MDERARSIVGLIEATLADEGGWSEWGDVEIGLAIGTSTCRDGDLPGAQQRADAEMLASKRLLRQRPRPGSRGSVPTEAGGAGGPDVDS